MEDTFMMCLCNLNQLEFNDLDADVGGMRPRRAAASSKD